MFGEYEYRILGRVFEFGPFRNFGDGRLRQRAGMWMDKSFMFAFFDMPAAECRELHLNDNGSHIAYRALPDCREAFSVEENVIAAEALMFRPEGGRELRKIDPRPALIDFRMHRPIIILDDNDEWQPITFREQQAFIKSSLFHGTIARNNKSRPVTLLHLLP